MVALYALIMLGNAVPVVLPETVLGLSAEAFWIVVLFVYAAIASMLPVWVLLQPRDYINGLQLFIALGPALRLGADLPARDRRARR